MIFEEFRDNEIGNTGYVMNSFKCNEVVILQHPKIVMDLMKQILKYLYALENSNNCRLFENNIECLKLVSISFICLECYVNDVLKLICKAGKRFKEYKNKKLNERVNKIIELAGYDSEKNRDFKKCGVRQQLQEFEAFRNIIFHGGFYEKQRFNKTVFSNNPYNCNIIDVLQALKILVDIFACFRFIVPNKDIMPQYFIDYKDKMYFEKVDVIYVEIIEPMFKFLSKKHGIGSNLDISLLGFNFQDAGMLKTEGVEFIIRAEQEAKTIGLSRNKTEYMLALLDGLTKDVIVDKECFRLPDYRRKNEYK